MRSKWEWIGVETYEVDLFTYWARINAGSWKQYVVLLNFAFDHPDGEYDRVDRA